MIWHHKQRNIEKANPTIKTELANNRIGHLTQFYAYASISISHGTDIKIIKQNIKKIEITCISNEFCLKTIEIVI